MVSEISQKGQKRSQIGQNRARDWKSVDTLAILITPIGYKNVAVIKGLKEMDWEFVRDQRLRMKAKDAPPRLEASLRCYK
ncbi:hypothetical protein Tco_1206351 [Tanacetum coccineum]